MYVPAPSAGVIVIEVVGDIADGVRAVVAEVGAIAQGFGLRAEFTGDRIVAMVRHQRHKSSIVQDLENGRPMEIVPTFELPLEMARLAGVATPTLDLLVALVRARAQAVGSYPSEGQETHTHVG
jgi:2-dehydropantoate 2-reductase